MTTPTNLREKAARYRKLAMLITNPAIVDAINELADEYDKKSAEIEQKDTALDRLLHHGSDKGNLAVACTRRPCP